MKKNDTGAPPPNLKAVPSYREPFPPPKPQQVFVGPYFPGAGEDRHCRACQSREVKVVACPGCDEWKCVIDRKTTEAERDAPGQTICYPSRREHLHVACSVCNAVSLYATRAHARLKEEAVAVYWQKRRARKYRLIAVTVGLNALMFGAGYLGYLWWLR